jgi:ATP-dependent Clp protease ATP-binding subunit ClpX
MSTDNELQIVDKHCLLCMTPASETTHYIETANLWGLCETCIGQFADGLLYSREEDQKLKSTLGYTPADIVEYLDKYIIGQNSAKKTLALAAYQHYKKQTDTTTRKPQKSNVLLLGPTGSCKTALIGRLAEYLDVPFIVYDATQLTETGYIGDDVSDMLASLYRKADNDLAKAQKGIICIDEVDKIHIGNDSKGIGSSGVQRMLLKTLESNIVQITKGGAKRSSMDDQISFDTTNVLFIGAGAFSDLPATIQKRLQKDNTGMGFISTITSKDSKLEYDEAMKNVDTDDLVEFGFMPEFMGRFTNLTHTESITPEVMKRILVEPADSAFKQTHRLLELDDVELEITDSAVAQIAELALKHKTGARALKVILNDVLKDAMFEYPSNIHIVKIVVDFKDTDFEVRCEDGYEDTDVQQITETA